MINVQDLRNSFAKLTSVSADKLNDSTELTSLEDWDSMAMVGTAAIIFEMTNASVAIEEVEMLVTFGDVVALAKSKLKITQ